MAESLFILELEFLHVRGGCSLVVVFFVLMLVGTCCFIMRSAPYVPSFTSACVVYEFSCRCEARYVGRTTQRLADRIKQHVSTSIRTKNTTTREQPPRTCKNSNSKMKSDSAIGQHLLTNPECAKTYTDDNFRIIGQARSSFHLGVLESVYIKTQNPVLCKQKEFVFSLGLFK